MTCEDLSRICADVDTARVERIGTHAVSQDAQLDASTDRQPFRHCLPLLSPIGGTVYRKLFADVVASHTVFDYCEDGIRVMRVESNGEAEFRWQIVLNINPVIASVQRLIDATVVLLIEDVWLLRMLDEAMDALSKFRVDIGLEAGTCIFVGKRPAFATVIGAYTPYRRDTDPHS